MDNRSVIHGMMVRVGMGVFGLLTLAMLVLTLTSDRGILEVRRKTQEYNDLQAQILQLEAENSGLIEEIQILRSEPFEIERRAREELRLVRPGEVILVLPSEPEE